MPEGAPLPGAGYDPAFFEALLAAEDHHFWFRHRNAVIADAVTMMVAGLEPGYRVLEVGCGTGNTLRVLERVCAGGTVTGSDAFDEGLRVARQRVRCELVHADIRDLPMPGPFAIIAAFDVLEHIQDDREALRELHQRLAPGGRLVLTVPADMALWSYADEAAHHFRRYSSRELRHALETTGLDVEYLTPFMSLVYPLMRVSRGLRRRRSTGADTFHLTLQDLRIVPVWNDMLRRALSCERPLLRRRMTLPLGTSLLAVARRP